MITEYDLPCSDCGGQLEQVRVPVDNRLDEVSESLLLAECVDCNAQYYPERVLDQI